MITYTGQPIEIKKTVILFLSFSVSLLAHAQDLSLYQKKWMVQGGDTLPYRLLLPLDYDSSKHYPLILFLHGAGERGRDNEKQLVHGAKLFLNEEVRQKHKAIVVFPQCPFTDYWANVLRVHDEHGRKFYFLEDGPPNRSMEILQQLVMMILKTYPIKKDQVYAGGLSMGGMGTFELVRRMPGVFTAAFPICGGANPATASNMKNVSWWIFHGAKDDVVLPAHSEKMVDALKAAGADVKWTLYPEANHNSWDAAFAEPLLLNWLMIKRKK